VCSYTETFIERNAADYADSGVVAISPAVRRVLLRSGVDKRQMRRIGVRRQAGA
jgi:hypothetical protein